MGTDFKKYRKQFLNLLEIPKTLDEIVSETGLSKSTCGNVLSYLEKAGLVQCVMAPGTKSKYEKVKII